MTTTNTLLSKSLVLLMAVLPTLVGCSVGQVLCQKQEECSNDAKGKEFVEVCSIQYDGSINALRANKETSCQDLANAQLALDACRAALDCDDFNESDLGGKCDKELENLNDANDDAGSECNEFDD